MGKVLEKLQAQRLSYFIGVHGLVPTTQFGSRPGCSTTDAVISFMHDITLSFDKGWTTSSLTFDIKGYFDFVNHARLLTLMREKHLPLPMIRWTASFLQERSTTICLDGKLSDMKPIENGIPQGSPISPALSSLYTAPLLQSFLDRAISHTDATRSAARLSMYADDGNIYVSSGNMVRNCKILESEHNRVDEWLRCNGLHCDMGSQELVHYTKSRKALSAQPSIRLDSTDIKPKQSIKWIGFILDSKLLFNQHVRSAATKAMHALDSMHLLANTARGLHQEHLRRLYIACIRPIMTYGSPVWWSQKKLHTKELERVQNKALRWICATFRTTPISAMEIEAAIPPVDLHLDYLHRRAAIRLNGLPPNSQIIQRLPPIWRMGSEPPVLQTAIQRKQSKTTTQLLRLSRLTSAIFERTNIFALEPWAPTVDSFDGRLKILPKKRSMSKKDAAKQHLEYVQQLNTDENHLVVYTDGSKLHTNGTQPCGSSAVFLRKGRELPGLSTAQSLGTKVEVYDAEMAALDFAALIAISFACINSIRHVHFFVDNNAAVQSIFEGLPGAAQQHSLSFRSAIIHFLKNDLAHTVEVAWAPGHHDIPGNERADKMAKEAARSNSHRPMLPSRSHQLRIAKELLLQNWKTTWLRSSAQGNFAPSNRLPPSLKPRKHFALTNRELYGRLIQCRTGHAFLGEYYRRFVPSEDPTCPCGATIQTRAHVIQDCDLFEDARSILYNFDVSLSLPEILGTPKGIDALTQFIRRSGAFKKRYQHPIYITFSLFIYTHTAFYTQFLYNLLYIHVTPIF